MAFKYSGNIYTDYNHLKRAKDIERGDGVSKLDMKKTSGYPVNSSQGYNYCWVRLSSIHNNVKRRHDKDKECSLHFALSA